MDIKVAILVFDGFSELDAFIPLALINHLRAEGWRAEIAGPVAQVTSVNGVTLTVQQPLEFANEADAVIFSGSLYARAVAETGALLDRLQMDPLRQLMAGQGSGTLLMARLGLLGTMPACADATVRPWLVQAGVMPLDGEPFHARGPAATAAGDMASMYLAAWLVWRKAGEAAACRALQHMAPAGRKDDYAKSVLDAVRPSLSGLVP
jgi:transcriptional regulator GlxA family with amidase domain